MGINEALVLILSITAQFEKDFNVAVSTSYLIEERGPEVHAYCTLETNTVTVNINHFKFLPARHKKELIYHELGHCTLMLKHVYDKPSIMRPRVYSTDERSSNWNSLLREMKDLLKNNINKYKYEYRK